MYEIVINIFFFKFTIIIGNNENIIRLLLLHEADPYVQDQDFFIPLSLATRCNRHRLAEILLEHMFPIHCVSEVFDALMIAIECEHYAVIDVIIRHISQLQCYNEKICYAVMLCVAECKHKSLDKLLTTMVDLCSSHGQKSLTSAVAKNCVMCSASILNHLSACTKHEKDIPTFLLYITCKNKNNSSDKLTVVKMLFDHGLDFSTFGSEALHISAWLGNVDIILYLLDHLRKTDTDIYKFAITRLLPLACENWQSSIVGLLLCCGADYTPRIVDDIWKDLLIHMSNFNNASSRVSALFYVYTQSLTTYSKAVGYKAYEIVENLLIHGADPNRISVDNNANYCLSAMFNESRYYYKTMLKLLLQVGFNPDTLVDVSNEPAILYSVKKKYFCTCAMLALSGADLGCVFSCRDINMIITTLSIKERNFVKTLKDHFWPSSLKVLCRRFIRQVVFRIYDLPMQTKSAQTSASLNVVTNDFTVESLTKTKPSDVLYCQKCCHVKQGGKLPYWIRLFVSLPLPKELHDYICLQELDDLVTNDTIVDDWSLISLGSIT